MDVYRVHGAEALCGGCGERIQLQTRVLSEEVEPTWRAVLSGSIVCGMGPEHVPAAARTVDHAELTARLGLSPDRMADVATWTGDPLGTTYTEEDAAELIRVWRACCEEHGAYNCPTCTRTA